MSVRPVATRLLAALFAAALLVIAAFVAFIVYASSRRLIDVWAWGAFMSPSLYLYSAMSLAALLEPLYASWALPAAIIRTERNDPSFWVSVLAGLVAFAQELMKIGIALFISWGAFPFGVDPSGNIRLRMLPFIPWPSQPFWG